MLSEFNRQIFYDTQQDAEASVRRGELKGFIYLSANFTESFSALNDLDEVDYTDAGIIQVYVDSTDLQIVTYLKRKLYDAYHSFVENLMTGCGKSQKAGSVPIAFEAIYGSLDGEIRHSLVPGLLIA